ncbi:MAG: T9SS type A sorting domain-containing protein [Flavobacteriales bacterium]
MRNTLLFAASLISILFANSSVEAQNASNYTCALAIPLPVASGNVQVTFMPLVGAALPGAAPVPVTSCSGSGTRGSAWYTFVATNTSHWIRTEGDAMDESSFDVFSGTCGSLTSILCVPGNSPIPEVTGLTPGQTYYLRVVIGNPFFCSVETCFLNLAVVYDPLNDECTGALELPVTVSTSLLAPAVEISTLGATQSQPGCTVAGASNDDVWYRFTATAATHFVPTQRLSGDALIVQGFSGTCGNLSNVFCNTDLATNLNIGQQYYLRAYSTSTDVAISNRSLIGVFEAAANDECAGAIPITVTESGDAPVAVSISTINATASTAPCVPANRDVWLSFVSPSTVVHVVGDRPGQSIGLFSGSCGSLSCVLSSTFDNSYDGLTAGATYFLKIGSNFSFANLKYWVFAQPENDECANAVEVPITSGDAASTFANGHTFGATTSLPQTCNVQPKDIWFRFTATRTNHTIVCMSSALPVSTKVEVLSGTCGDLTSIECDFGTPNIPLTGLVVGTTYYVRTYGNTSLTGIRLAVLDPVPNDDCEGAIPLSYNTLDDFDQSNMKGNFLATDGAGTCGTLKDVWYTFTAASTSAGFVAAGSNTVGGSVELLTGTCGSLTQVACYSGLGSIITKLTGLNVGTEYHLRVSTSNVGGTMFQPMLFDRPVNDEMAGALDVPVGGTQFAQPVFGVWNYGATQSYADMCGTNYTSDEDTWFHFTATATTHTVSASQQNLWYFATPVALGMRIEVYDTLSTDFATLDAGMFSCGYSPRNLTGLTVGKEYWYRVYTVQAGAANTCAFVTAVSGENNDEAVGAMELYYGDSYSAVFNTDGATQSQPGAACSVADFADDDIWFKFVATNANARVVVAEHNEDVTLELFSGTPGNLVSIACSDNILVVPTLTAGQTYFARLYSWKNATDTMGKIGLFITPDLTENTCVDETCLGPVLLSNPSIEQGAYCLPHISEISNLDGLGSVMAPGWPRYFGGSSDSFSSCANVSSGLEVPAAGGIPSSGKVLSRSGKGMAGIITKEFGSDYIEYISAPLSEPLVPGEAYLVSFHIRSGSVLCTNGFGAALTKGPYVQWNQSVLTAQPQLFSEAIVPSGEWTNICGIIVPTEPLDHITIGSFSGEGQIVSTGLFAGRAYYFIDDVVVALVADPSCITSIGDVPPLDESAGAGDALRVYPNPANELLNIVADPSLFGKRAVIEVFDVTGSRVHAEQVNYFSALQPLNLSQEWKEGLYLVMVRVEGQTPKAARVVVKH